MSDAAGADARSPVASTPVFRHGLSRLPLLLTSARLMLLTDAGMSDAAGADAGSPVASAFADGHGSKGEVEEEGNQEGQNPHSMSVPLNISFKRRGSIKVPRTILTNSMHRFTSKV